MPTPHVLRLKSGMSDAGPFAVVPTREAAMREILRRMLRILFGPLGDGDDVPCAGIPKTEVHILQEKIRKWERQGDEYEAMGLTELARRSRQSVRWYRLRLKTLADPRFRRAA